MRHYIMHRRSDLDTLGEHVVTAVGMIIAMPFLAALLVVWFRHPGGLHL
jgi:hypothetical protein